YGRQLADAVQRVVAAPMALMPGNLTMTYREIELPFSALPTREQLVEDARSDKKMIANRAKYLLKQIEAQGSLRGSYPYPVQIWRFGDSAAARSRSAAAAARLGFTWLALGGEVVVDYALRLKQMFGADDTWVMGYANDV